MKEEDIKVTTTKIKPISKPLRPSPSQPIIVLPDRYIGISQPASETSDQHTPEDTSSEASRDSCKPPSPE